MGCYSWASALRRGRMPYSTRHRLPMLNPAEVLVLSYAVASRLPPKATGTVVIAKEPSVETHLPSVEAYRKFRAFDKLAALSEESVLDLLAKEREPFVFEQPFRLPRPS